MAKCNEMLKEFAAHEQAVAAGAGRRRAMKRTVFKNRWLPYLLVPPQMAVTVVFFFWPAFKSLQLSRSTGSRRSATG